MAHSVFTTMPRRRRVGAAAAPNEILVPTIDEAQDIIIAHQAEPCDVGPVMCGLQGAFLAHAPPTENVGADLLCMAAGLLRDDVRTFWNIAGTRPVLTEHLRQVARPLWQEKWDQHKNDPCPICLTEHGGDDVWDGPMNSDIPTRCNHWLCTACWDGLVETRPEEVRCPVCREDVTEWSGRYFEAQHPHE